MRLKSGRPCLLGTAPWLCWPPDPLAELTAVFPTEGGALLGGIGGGKGGTMPVWALFWGKFGGRGGLGGKGAFGGKGGEAPGRPKPPRAVLGPLKGVVGILPLTFCCGMTVEVKIVALGGWGGWFPGTCKLDSGLSRISESCSGSSCVSEMPPMFPKNPGAWRVSEKKFWCGRTWPVAAPSGLSAFSTKEHWVLQILSRLTAS